MISNLAFGQLDFSDKSNFIDLGKITEKTDFGCPYNITLDIAVYSQAADASDAAAFNKGVTFTLDFLYFSPDNTKLTLTAYNEAKEVISRREWKNVMLSLMSFQNGGTGYEIKDLTDTYSFARIIPNIKGNRYWSFFNPILLRDVL